MNIKKLLCTLLLGSGLAAVSSVEAQCPNLSFNPGTNTYTYNFGGGVIGTVEFNTRDVMLTVPQALNLAVPQSNSNHLSVAGTSSLAEVFELVADLVPGTPPTITTSTNRSVLGFVDAGSTFLFAFADKVNGEICAVLNNGAQTVLVPYAGIVPVIQELFNAGAIPSPAIANIGAEFVLVLANTFPAGLISLITDVVNLAAQVSSLTTTNANQAAQITQLQTDLGICQNSLTAEQNANALCQTNLASEQAANSLCQANLLTCQGSLTNEQNANAQCQASLANEQTLNAQCTASNASLQNQLNMANQALANSTSLYNQCVADKANVQNQLNQCTSAASTQTASNTALQGELSSLKSKLSSVKAGTFEELRRTTLERLKYIHTHRDIVPEQGRKFRRTIRKGEGKDTRNESSHNATVAALN